MSIFRKGPTPETVTPEAQNFNAFRGITASAERVDLKNAKEVQAIGRRQKADKWQYEAWDYYNYIAEVQYCATLVADIVSRINIFCGYVTDSSMVPSPMQSVHKEDIDEQLQKDAINAMRLLESGTGGSSGLLRTIALNMFITGECYLVKEPATYTRSERWQARSVHELVVDGSGTAVSLKPRADAKKEEYLPLNSGAYAARMWRNHPQYSGEADSSMRSVLDLCEQLLLVSRQDRVHSRSALNNGILYIPDEISNLYESDGDGPDDEGLNRLADANMPTMEEEFLNSVLESIESEMAGSTVAPFILRGPAEFADKIKHITLQRPLDSTTVEKVNSLLDRILSGLAIPKDVAAGLSGVKYSNAIIVHETLYSSHIEPITLLIVDQLTEAFLRPVLKSYGYSDEQIRDIVVWYDPSAITAKPSKAEAATIGFENKIISKAAWRRANGFGESDAPDEMEKAERLAEEKGLVSEAMMERIMSMLYPTVFNGLRQDQLGAMNPEDAGALEEAIDAPEDQPEAPAEGDDVVTEPEGPVDTSDATSDFNPEG